MLRTETLALALASAIGVVPSKIMFPSKKEYVRLTAFELQRGDDISPGSKILRPADGGGGKTYAEKQNNRARLCS